MNRLKLMITCVLVGASVALVYYLFEAAVRHSIDYIWGTVFDTATARLLVVPLCIGLTIVFFGLQNWLDPKSRNHESHGLGGDGIDPTFRNLLIILCLGYFSLIAGASLGPEAVLVPASMVVGLLFGVKLFNSDKQSTKTLAAAAFIALFAAFFHSFIVGFLSLFLVTKQAKVKLSSGLVVVALLASASSFLTLRWIDSTNQYFHFPDFSWETTLIDLFLAVFLIAGGYIATFGLKYAHRLFMLFSVKLKLAVWWQQAVVAGLVLSVLYLIGGTLVEFTGNQSIEPLLQQASGLGMLGLLWITIVKLMAIAWSKALGYRGGLIFPMIFVASCLVAMAQIVYHDTNFGVGLVAALVGIMAAERKAKILL